MKIKLQEISSNMYLVAFSLIVITNILFVESTMETFLWWNKDGILNLCENLIWVLLFLRASMLVKYTRREYVKILIILVLAICSVYFSGGSYLLLSSMLFILASKGIDFEKVVKVCLYSNILGVSVIVILALLGKIDANVVSRVYDGNKVIMRFSLGFEHPNYLGAHIFIICLCIGYLWFYKMGIKVYITLIVLDLLIFATCYSRTNFILIILWIIVSGVVNKANSIVIGEYKGAKFLLACMPVIAMVLSMIPTIFYNENIFGKINDFVSNRLLYSHEYYKKYGFSILGQIVDFSEISTRSYTIDNAYIYLAIRFGIIIAITFPVLFYKVAKNAARKELLNMLALMVVVSIWGISETYYFRIQYNFALILIGWIIFEGKNSFSEMRKKDEFIV